MTKKSPFGLTLTPLVLVTALGATACGDVSDPVDPSNGSEAEDVVSDAVTLRLTNNTPQRVYFTVFQDNSGLGSRAASLAWQVVELEPATVSTQVQWQWDDGFSFSAASAQLQAGAVYTADETKDADPTSGNSVIYDSSGKLSDPTQVLRREPNGRVRCTRRGIG